MRGEKLFLKDIVDSIDLILSYTDNLIFKQFEANQMVIDAVMRNFEIIGEATTNLSQETKEIIPEIPWHEIVGMRNILAHEYFGADIEVVWKTIKERIVPLKLAIQNSGLI